MPVSCTAEDRVLRVTITGEVDHHRAREMMDVLDREIDMELPRRLTVDLGAAAGPPAGGASGWDHDGAARAGSGGQGPAGRRAGPADEI